MSVPPRAVQLNEANAFLKEHPEVQFVDLLIADMNGVVRGKRIDRNALHKVYEKGINLPASLFALDINGSTVESTGLGLDIGDADRICFPIPNTLCNEPWQKRPTAQLLMTMHERDGAPFFADPREVLLWLADEERARAYTAGVLPPEDAAFAFGLRQRGLQLAHHLQRHGVAHLRPVQRQVQDAGLVAGNQSAHAPRLTSSCPAACLRACR